MKKLLIALFALVLFLPSCGKKKITPLVGKVYTYQSGIEKQTIGFSDDKLYFKWDDSLGIDAYQTDYTMILNNDSLITITVKDKPKYWESDKWEIVMKDDGFYTLASKKYYKQNSDVIDKTK
jgi:hypothetical protein